MISVLRYLAVAVFALSCNLCMAQNREWKEMHKVKKGETVFGISKQYGVTIDELKKANPDMAMPGYSLKKGDYIFIPYSSSDRIAAQQAATSQNKGALNVGVMLPLHDVDGDGRRMVEYYRGLLMACEDLKKEGMSISLNAWNVPKDADIYQTLVKEGAADCDIIFGPLYSSQVKPLSYFSKDNGIRIVIPFSITGNDVESNPNIFQVYQSPDDFNDAVINHFAYRFKDCHVVIIDCNDNTSDKGPFTSALRKKLDSKKISYSLTNLNTNSSVFARAFNVSKPNMVVLNTGRSPELSTVLNMLDAITSEHPQLKVSLFGYTEWLMYVKHNSGRFCKYDTYIPTNFYYNPVSSKIKEFENRYRRKFKNEMMDYLPRFALTGYDHGMFFLGGLGRFGPAFDGSEGDKNALQTRLRFEKVKRNGGFRNNTLMFVHYNRDNSITLINF